MRNVYEFRSRWEIPTSRDDLWDAIEVLLASDNPMPWWTAVSVLDYRGGDLLLRAKSHIGYTLEFRLNDLVATRPETMTFDSDGDLRGSGNLSFVDIDADRSAIDIHWHVGVDRAWMKATSWILRPVFTLGHHLVMNQGERKFNSWLATQGTGSPRRQ
ncbi:MAG: hypothetical protein ABIR57_14475 [Aeromicrobium sp.]